MNKRTSAHITAYVIRHIIRGFRIPAADALSHRHGLCRCNRETDPCAARLGRLGTEWTASCFRWLRLSAWARVPPDTRWSRQTARPRRRIRLHYGSQFDLAIRMWRFLLYQPAVPVPLQAAAADPYRVPQICAGFPYKLSGSNNIAGALSPAKSATRKIRRRLWATPQY